MVLANLASFKTNKNKIENNKKEILPKTSEIKNKIIEDTKSVKHQKKIQKPAINPAAEKNNNKIDNDINNNKDGNFNSINGKLNIYINNNSNKYSSLSKKQFHNQIKDNNKVT